MVPEGRLMPASIPVSERLTHHLSSWLGTWPPTSELVVVTSDQRSSPGWEGSVLPMAGMRAPEGIVISVAPEILETSIESARTEGLKGLERVLAAHMPFTAPRLHSCSFRWCENVVDAPEAGDWISPLDSDSPAWLRPYQEALVVNTSSGCAGAIGIKHHDAFGHELAIRISPRVAAHHNLAGLGRRMGARAVRKVLADGAVPTVILNHDNVRSAAICRSVGFQNKGWDFLAMVSGPAQNATE